MAGGTSIMAPPLIVLFGYDASVFTNKIKLALRLRQIPYTFIVVPYMMPRLVLVTSFNLTYRKIPVLAIGKEVYIDTSLILEIIAHHPSYPPSDLHPLLHPDPQLRTFTRLLSSHYIDRPLFRINTGLIPQSVWESSFGQDRAKLIGHKLNPSKLGAKIPRNLVSLDTQLSILEPAFSQEPSKWLFPTPHPTALDIALYNQLDWASKVSKGIGFEVVIGHLQDPVATGIDEIFNATRYPHLYAWFTRIQSYFSALPSVETRVEQSDTTTINSIISSLNTTNQSSNPPLLQTPASHIPPLDARSGLVPGTRVSITPDDTGRGDPTVGVLVAMSTEEIVIVPEEIGGREPDVRGVRLHFPRVGFLINPMGSEDPVRVGATGAKSRL